jgi:hypothetical protein
MYPVCLRQANEAFNDRLLKLKVACRTDIGWRTFPCSNLGGDTRRFTDSRPQASPLS